MLCRAELAQAHGQKGLLTGIADEAETFKTFIY
jgi:hypothetical protein